MGSFADGHVHMLLFTFFFTVAPHQVCASDPKQAVLPTLFAPELQEANHFVSQGFGISNQDVRETPVVSGKPRLRTRKSLGCVPAWGHSPTSPTSDL